jgi:hypothetical protein
VSGTSGTKLAQTHIHVDCANVPIGLVTWPILYFRPLASCVQCGRVFVVCRRCPHEQVECTEIAVRQIVPRRFYRYWPMTEIIIKFMLF